MLSSHTPRNRSWGRDPPKVGSTDHKPVARWTFFTLSSRGAWCFFLNEKKSVLLLLCNHNHYQAAFTCSISCVKEALHETDNHAPCSHNNIPLMSAYLLQCCVWSHRISLLQISDNIQLLLWQVFTWTHPWNVIYCFACEMFFRLETQTFPKKRCAAALWVPHNHSLSVLMKHWRLFSPYFCWMQQVQALTLVCVL